MKLKFTIEVLKEISLLVSIMVSVVLIGLYVLTHPIILVYILVLMFIGIMVYFIIQSIKYRYENFKEHPRRRSYKKIIIDVLQSIEN